MCCGPGTLRVGVGPGLIPERLLPPPPVVRRPSYALKLPGELFKPFDTWAPTQINEGSRCGPQVVEYTVRHPAFPPGDAGRELSKGSHLTHRSHLARCYATLRVEERPLAHRGPETYK